MEAKQLALDIYELAQWMEDDGNHGYRRRDVEAKYRYVLETKHTSYRKDIFFYSEGWGWRVRKKPHWKEVYKERFSQWYQPVDPASD